jgi:hypothetical protein
MSSAAIIKRLLFHSRPRHSFLKATAPLPADHGPPAWSVRLISHHDGFGDDANHFQSHAFIEQLAYASYRQVYAALKFLYSV